MDRKGERGREREGEREREREGGKREEGRGRESVTAASPWYVLHNLFTQAFSDLLYVTVNCICPRVESERNSGRKTEMERVGEK